MYARGDLGEDRNEEAQRDGWINNQWRSEEMNI